MFCQNCGTPLKPDVRFCKKCGMPVNAASAPTEVVADAPPTVRQPSPALPTAPIYAPPPPPLPPSPSPLPPPLPSPSPLPPTPSSSPSLPAWARDKRLLGGVIGGVAVILAASLFWYSRGAVERDLDAAVAKGNLLKPPSESAYDYYRKLKERGLSESARARLAAKLMPLVTARPQQMIRDLASPGNSSEMTKSDWQDAQTLMNWAAELQPGDNAIAARVDYCAGRVAYLENRKDDALTFWKRAAEQDSAWAMPLNSAGLIYTERKNYPTARTFFLEAIRREPQLALPYNNTGTSYFYEKNDTQAEGYYRQAIERAPQWARPHAWLGDIAMRRKDFNVAVQEYETVLKLDPAGITGIDANRIRQQLEQARGGANAISSEDTVSYVDVRGSIGNLKIVFNFNWRSGRVTGSYRYEGRGESLRLEGNVSGDGAFTLTEFAPSGQKTGTLAFKGTPNGNAEVVYAGTWMSADGQRKLPFKLEPLGD
jgi:tetratricopeptide (TPR) repeat protein